MHSSKDTSAWIVYMLRFGSGSLYTGATTDLARRVAEHRSGGSRAAKALRGKGPLELVFQALAGSKSRALKIEASIKSLRKAQKEALVSGRIVLGPAPGDLR